MPIASLYTTKEVQDKLMYGIQDVIVKSFTTLYENNSLVKNVWAIINLVRVVRRIHKLPTPTHANVNMHNQHVMVDIRDDFLAHDDPKGSRPLVYHAMFNLMIWIYDAFLILITIKYGFDGHMGRRFDYAFKQWKESDWIFTGKPPETQWILSEKDEQEPEVIRYRALQEALSNKDWPRVLNLVE